MTIAYWIWIGLEVALLLAGGVYFKLLKSLHEEDGHDGAKAASDAVKDSWKEDDV